MNGEKIEYRNEISNHRHPADSGEICVKIFCSGLSNKERKKMTERWKQSKKKRRKTNRKIKERKIDRKKERKKERN